MISQIDLLVNMSPTWEGGKCQTGFNKSCVTLLMMRTSRTSRIFMSTTLSLLASLPTNLAWVTASARFTTATCTPGLPQPAGVQVCRCAGLHLFICSGVQKTRCTSISMCRCASVQMCKLVGCSGMQARRCGCATYEVIREELIYSSQCQASHVASHILEWKVTRNCLGTDC